ncbi:hypothetical protein BJF83_21080 [Nocardiopsis sp. CNR-923]|uniref:hypothetical protein n=1 Tax=Nocardiopsis sp. CNR-923 TaxID=1904965 RepID=UPI000964D822|nr:hypothetical protein [Nocardiopsis sp. CNR-923]OLT26504.1 hypothetical protein BJF83_21080 [Nocardiopsis sp. CNR-923]
MDLSDDLGARLGLAFQQMAHELHAHLAEAGFTDLRQSFGFAFKLLARERLTIGQLAERMGVTHQARRRRSRRWSPRATSSGCRIPRTAGSGGWC